MESLDPEVVAFAPMVASHHPRVIAVGEGNGDLLQVTLLLAEECRTSTRPKMKGAGPLATASASVTVDFSTSDLQHRPDILQNDGGSYGGTKREFQDLQDILKGEYLNLPRVITIGRWSSDVISLSKIVGHVFVSILFVSIVHDVSFCSYKIGN